MNTSVISTKSQKQPLWLLVLLTALAIIVLSSVFIYANKKLQENPNSALNQTVLETRKKLLLLQDDVIDTNWLRTLNPIVRKVQGRLLWSTNLQQGVLEFENLPQISDKQNYRLWIYDLLETRDKPISGAVFNQVENDRFLVSFDPDSDLSAPFKFELVLQTDGEAVDQPLLLAQP